MAVAQVSLIGAENLESGRGGRGIAFLEAPVGGEGVKRLTSHGHLLLHRRDDIPLGVGVAVKNIIYSRNETVQIVSGED